MNFITCVDMSNNINETKRMASAYVEDSRRLDLTELKASLVKTREQYLSQNNITTKLSALKLYNDARVRIIVPIFLQYYLIEQDDYISPCKATEEAILTYEQAIIDASNNYDFRNLSKDFSLFKFVLDTAWKHDDNISVDEKNLIEEIRKYLNISIDEQNILEAKSGRYPTLGNLLHTRTDIDNVRKVLQTAGILFHIKNSDGIPCDVIPEEIANLLRKIWGIEIKKYAYEQLLTYVVKVTKKQYLIDIINKYNDVNNNSVITLPANPNISLLKEIILKNIKPSNLIGGFSPRDGLDSTVLSKWCNDLGLLVSGTKPALIDRIMNYYDSLRQIEISSEDERLKYYNCYHELSCRDLQSLRKSNIITKDLECEHLFETATNYLFEVKLKNKPLILTGSEHPDGKLSFKDKYIMWDNKSKESSVNLKDHILQFDKYIRNSDKPVSVFIVIGPSFTENSAKECVKYSLINETLILLITADELKKIAEDWSKNHPDESFNLGYFRQNGRFNEDLLK